MSRICVKNLPKYATEDRLRDFFSQKGEITDAKLMRTKEGKSRQFAFIGFRSEREAEEALNFFNNSFMDTSRITCEVARKVGDSNIPRPWSRHSTKEDKFVDQNKKMLVEEKSHILQKGREPANTEAKKPKTSEINDPQLQEFLQVMQSRAKSKIWDDGTVNPALLNKKDNAKEEDLLSKSKKNQTRKKNKLADRTSSSPSLEGCAGSNQIKQSNETAHNSDISDMDYFKSKVKKNWSDSETDDGDSSNDVDSFDDEGLGSLKSLDAEFESEDHTVEIVNSQIREDFNHDGTMAVSFEDSDVEENENENPTALNSDDKKDFETGRLFIRNLPYTANEDELLELFGQFGDVSQVHLVVDKHTKRSKGFAYVLFKLPESAVRAFEELDNSIFQGRLLHILPAKPQKMIPEKVESNSGPVKNSFKQQRDDQRKASEASGDTRAWNSLFIRPDTVVENIARKQGISKSDLLEREADDLAVRIALGETLVVAETKKSLSSAGINVAALEEFASKKNDKVKRSNHVILVKNLPYGSSEGELASMFGKFGSLEKIILPPTKALALVVFLEASEARASFRGLAYKRYKDAPLYLEWAPGDILCPTQKSEQDDPNKSISEEIIKPVSFEQMLGTQLEDDIDPDRAESKSIFVKNLNFKTSDEALKRHFSDHLKNGGIRSVKVKMHVKNGKNVSMGFGFIEFDSVETATSVLRDLQGTILDGHALNLQLCHAKKDGQVLKKGDKDLSSTKLLIKNVAFEATEKDLKQLFSPFGQIKRLRLPMKFGNHRGFAFVEFVTKQEAHNALQALSSTHLYGRHLVLERAKEGETLEELRAKTAEHFVDEQTGFQKLSKKRKQMSIPG